MSDTRTLAASNLKQVTEQARELREHFLREKHRPGYHFIVPEGVHAPVDPNGALFYNGRYHLCYIYQHQGKHYWGHVSSIDLLHWRHHEPALAPEPAGTPGGDDGIFSGGAFIDKNGVPTISYWRLGSPDGISIASSTDPNLDRWTRPSKNPVIPSTQCGMVETKDDQGNAVVYGSADPSQIWIKDGRYYMLTGNLLVLNELGNKRNLSEHKGDRTYLFVSDDLLNWTYLHPFYESDRHWTRETEDDMCPDFFPLPSSPEGGAPSDMHMLLFISHNWGCQYYLGKYDQDKFAPKKHGRMTWVDNEYFAPESLTDDKGRRIMWSWIFDRRSQETKEASGWSGELSLPRLLWLGHDGTLRMRPADELKTLRYNPKVHGAMQVNVASAKTLSGFGGDSIELEIKALIPKGGTLGVKVCASPDGTEETLIVVDRAAGTLNVDTRKSSLGEGSKVVESAPFVLGEGEALELRIFIDKSIIEVYANERQAVVRRVYPTRADSLGVGLMTSGEPVRVESVKQWEIMPSNPY